MDVSFRFMTLQDLDRIVEIEQLSFTLPWSRSSFYQELTNNRYARYIVMEHDGQIIGYCGMWLVMDEAHITNIAVLPEFRGKNSEKR